MKKTFLSIAKIALSIFTIPMWFVKIFVGIGHLPNQYGDIVEVIFRHSMFENVSDGISVILPCISIALALISVITNILALKYPNSKKISLLSNILFWITAISFLCLLLLASTVSRGY